MSCYFMMTRGILRLESKRLILNNYFNGCKNKLLWYELIKCDIKCIEIHGSSKAIFPLTSLSTYSRKQIKIPMSERGREREREREEGRDDRNGMFKAKEVFMTSHQLKSNIERVTRCLGEGRTCMTLCNLKCSI